MMGLAPRSRPAAAETAPRRSHCQTSRGRRWRHAKKPWRRRQDYQWPRRQWRRRRWLWLASAGMRPRGGHPPAPATTTQIHACQRRLLPRGPFVAWRLTLRPCGSQQVLPHAPTGLQSRHQHAGRLVSLARSTPCPASRLQPREGGLGAGTPRSAGQLQPWPRRVLRVLRRGQGAVLRVLRGRLLRATAAAATVGCVGKRPRPPPRQPARRNRCHRRRPGSYCAGGSRNAALAAESAQAGSCGSGCANRRLVRANCHPTPANRRLGHPNGRVTVDGGWRTVVGG
jgi:hypothetical protein